MKETKKGIRKYRTDGIVIMIIGLMGVLAGMAIATYEVILFQGILFQGASPGPGIPPPWFIVLSGAAIMLFAGRCIISGNKLRTATYDSEEDPTETKGS